MKKLLVSTLLPAFVFGQMTITSQEVVSQTLKPDVLRSTLGFEEHSLKSDSIKTHLNTIVAEVKNFDSKSKMCSGGGYSLYPSYNYKEGKQEFNGYSAHLNFSCEFNSIDQFNALNQRIDKVIASSTKRSQGGLTWGVSDKLQDETKQTLRAAMINKTRQQASLFSKETTMQCSVISIDFGSYPRPPIAMRNAAMMDVAASAPTESPLMNDEESIVSATVSYNCQ